MGSGKFANAISLDGINDHIRDYNFQGITGNARRTIALWFKTSTANKPILQYGANGTATLFKLSLNSAGAAVLDLGGTTITSSSTGSCRWELASCGRCHPPPMETPGTPRSMSMVSQPQVPDPLRLIQTVQQI